jgi:dephospho-CoA kinase
MMVVGLTGGIGCGKTAVAEIFAQLGAAIIDVDLINKQITQAGQPCFSAIVAQFGKQVVAADGELDRRLLRQIIFQDSEQRAALEAILHPAIYQASLAKLAQIKHADYALLVVPLLFEHANFMSIIQRSLVVDCPPEVQLQRVCSRDKIDAQQALQIIQAQMPRAQRLALADDVIVNDQDLAHLQQQVQRLHARYQSTSKES